ncbi:MAG: leucine-rich repeat protein [Lachnospiraceae bacterium]|nr:leucine-rich repeat protein [Lachnospiraceae bacterium]
MVEKTLPSLAMGDNTVSSKADKEVFYKFTVSENGIYEIYGKDVILGADDEEEGPIELKLWDNDGNENDYDSGGSRFYAYQAAHFEAKAGDVFTFSLKSNTDNSFFLQLRKVPQLVFTDGTYQTESLNSLRHYLYHADKTGYLNLKIEDGGLSMIAVGAYFNGIDSRNRTYIVNEGQDYILKVWPDDEESSASLTITGRFDEASYLADKPLYDLNEKVMDATRMRYNNGYRAGKDADYDTFGDFEIVNKTDEYTFYAYRYDKALILKAYEEYQKLSDKQKKAFDTYFKDRRDVLLAGYEKATEGQAKPPAVADKQDVTSSQTNDTQTSVGSKTTVQGAEYQVVAEGQVKYNKPTDQKKSSYTVPATVKVGNKTMKVTVFDTKAMKGCSKMKRLTVGKNVTKIVGKGLNGKKKLKKVTIKSTKITKVDKGAFKNLAKGAKIYLPKKMKTKYKKLFKKNVIGNAKIVWK